jgi:putative ABC transport system permease protein
MPHQLLFWLRWTWRDLRERWLQVCAIALIIALGTATYVGLGSTTPWRLESAEASYDLLNNYDMRVILPPDTYVDRATFEAAVRGIPHTEWLVEIEPRINADTFVRVMAGDEQVLVRGKLLGVDVTDAGPQINGIYVNEGRALTEADAGSNTAILEYHFGKYYDLPPAGELTLSGGVTLEYVGLGMTPEYFMVTTEEGGMWAQASFTAVMVPLETAQRITGHAGECNDLLLTLTDDADVTIVKDEIETAMAAALPDVGVTFRTRSSDAIYQLMFDSITMNQQIYDLMIVLFMAGASFGAFNLASRIVEAQRRQIGIGMALGMPPRLLVVRPLLVGAQIAVLGALFGLLLGLVVGKLTEFWIAGLIPLPVTGQLFQPDLFLEAAALGFVLPFIATIVPVWRAVRVLPVDAIKTGHLIEKTKANGLTSTLAQLPVPGKSFTQIPVRNLLRSPRRAALTILGVAAAVTTLVGLVGVLDGAVLGLSHVRDELYQDHPHRLTVFLNSFYPIDAPQIAELRGSAALTHAEPAIRLPGEALRGETHFKVLIEALSLDNDLWTPTTVKGGYALISDMPGVVISKNAAIDLAIGVGDTFVLKHPQRTGLFDFQFVETEVQVIGLHADEWRTFVYMDLAQADMLGLAGLVNILEVNPQPGLSSLEAKSALFESGSVASVVAVSEAVESSEGVMEEVMVFLSGVQIAALAMAFLIAFNSTNINMNEREREIATMFAFGLPVRTVTRMAMIENFITGVFGTLLGMGLGALFTSWFMTVKMVQIIPAIRLPITFSNTTLALAVFTGVVVTTLTPLLTMRKMLAMDIPSTLRVME